MRLVPKGNNKNKGRDGEAFLCAESLVRIIAPEAETRKVCHPSAQPFVWETQGLRSMKREGGAQLQDACGVTLIPA